MFQKSKLFILLIFPLLLTAQQSPQTFKILGISVEGQTVAEANAIIANTGLRVGDEITLPGEQTRIAIRRLYNLRLFDDISLEIERKIQDGVFLIIRVSENPRLERVEIVGNDELSETDITKKINLTKGQLITKQDLSTVIRVLKAAYDEEGHLNAEIRTELVPIETGRNRVVLKIKITENEPVKVDRIRFFGNKAFDDSDLRGAMKETSERRWWKFWSSAKFDSKKFEEDKKLIVQFYRKNGYRDAEILTDSSFLDDSRRYLTIDLYLFEGPQFIVRNIVWEGNTVYPSELLSERLGFATGDIYDQEKFEMNLRRNESETDVSSLYYDNGYLMFQVETEEVRVGEDSLDIILRVRERNQFRIGRILLSGNIKTYDKVLRRTLLTLPGDYFSRQKLILSVRRLSQLNYFNPEKIQPDYRIVDDKTVDIEYSVEEKSSDTFNMSVGYSGAFGFNGAIGLAFNNFSLREPFKGGAGQQLSFDWQFGEGNRYRTFSVSFTEPWMFDTPTLFGASVFDTRQIYYYDLQITGGTLRIGRAFRWPDPFFRGDWSVRAQRNDVKYGGGYYPEGITTQMSMTQVLSRNSTDSPIFPSRGSDMSLLTEISGGPFLPGNAEYHKHVYAFQWYVPVFGSTRVAMALSTTGGFIFGFRKDAYIPPQDYFYMGGTGLGQFSTTPLRGYEDRSVGPRFGGKTMIKHLAELRFALALNPVPIYTLAFAEAGNVWNDLESAEPNNLRRSAGLGVRLMINPIGLIGFDYGYGFDGEVPSATSSGWKFHFQFGRNF